MKADAPQRWLVIGNSGSGKSTLAERAGARSGVPTYDLDLFHWLPGGGKRDETEAKALVDGVAAHPAWIIEGVYGWLADVALGRATTLVWLDLPWSECRDGLLRRGLRRGMTVSDQEALLGWASAYWTRKTPSSYSGHERLYRSFKGRKLRLLTRPEVTAFCSTGSFPDD